MELPNIIRFNYFLTQHQYTKAGNLSVNTTHNRMKKNRIAYLEIDGQIMIDTRISSPTARYKKNSPAVYAAIPQNIDIKKLVHLTSYARKINQTANKFYEAILLGKITGIILGIEIFCYREEITQL